MTLILGSGRFPPHFPINLIIICNRNICKFCNNITSNKGAKQRYTKNYAVIEKTK